MTLKFSVIIPARYASTRLPGKPLADIAGKPMVVRVAERARRERRGGSPDRHRPRGHRRRRARRHGYEAVMTSARHASGTDRLAEVAARRRYAAGHIVVNVQGDEPLIDPSLIRRVAASLARRRDAHMATAAHPLRDAARARQSERRQGRARPTTGYALYFSRAPDPVRARRLRARHPRAFRRGLPVYRHLGIYAYRAGFLRRFTRLAPAADRALRGAGAAARARARLPHRRRDHARARRTRAWTRRRTCGACAGCSQR